MILVVSGGHDVIVTFYENYVNSQFMVIFDGFREKNLENLKFNRSKQCSTDSRVGRTPVGPHPLDIQYSDRQLMFLRVTLMSWEQKEQKASGQLAPGQSLNV